MKNLQELQTIRDFIRYFTSQFNQAKLYFGHGTDNAWDEAVALTFYGLNLSHELYAQVLDARLTEPEKHLLVKLAEQRITTRKPLPYLTHEAWFAGMKFYVDERVLIPRSPIAELIQNDFSPWIEETKIQHILDLCCGSACIAIACAKQFPDAQIDAADINQDALDVAEINVSHYHLNDQIRLIQSDLFANLQRQKYDVIIANPPYVDAMDMQNLPAEYQHEPAIALKAGIDGLDCVSVILQQAHKHLTPHGILICEVGNSAQALMEKYPHLPFTWLEFTHGEAEVFLLHYEDLVN